MAKRKKIDERELESPEMWNFEKAHRAAPQRSGRTVVSVSFNHNDFDRVARSAEATGMKTSEFIRRAVLDRISGTEDVAALFDASAGGGSMIFVRGAFPTTALRSRFDRVGHREPVVSHLG